MVRACIAAASSRSSRFSEATGTSVRPWKTRPPPLAHISATGLRPCSRSTHRSSRISSTDSVTEKDVPSRTARCAICSNSAATERCTRPGSAGVPVGEGAAASPPLPTPPEPNIVWLLPEPVWPYTMIVLS